MGTGAAAVQEYSAIEVVENIAALPATTSVIEGKFYYAKAENVFCFPGADGWYQVNPDTGATSIEAVGTGNAVTEATYDAITRKITLTKGETFATKSALDELSEEVDGLVTAGGEPNKLEKVKVNGTELSISPEDKSVNVLIAEGETNGTVAVNGTDVAVHGLGSAAYTEASAYDAAGAAKDIQGETTATVKSVEDSVAAIKDGTSIDSFADVETALSGKQPTGDYATKTEAQDYANAKVASVTAGDASVTVNGTATAPTVAVKLSEDADNAMELVDDGVKVVIPAAAEYSIVKDADSGDYAAIYHLTKNGANVGTAINIPKDMVVQSGSVVTDPEGQTPGTYIELILQNVAAPLYINVGSLIEYVTSGSQTGDMIVITVSEDHKVTATITDGTITLAKLTTDVQTAIGKAHSHDNADVLSDITATDVENWDDAMTKKHTHANATVLDNITTEKVAAWDAAEENAKDYADSLADSYDAAGTAAQALADAKTYADGLNTAMDARVDALEVGMAWGSF